MLKQLLTRSAMLAGCAMVSLSMCNRAMADDALSSGDTKFVNTAAIGGMTEVKLSNLAADKATDPEVKSFAQKMVEDHTKANEELKAAAKKKGVDVPPTLDSEHQDKVAALSKLSGADFDKQYVKDMVADHEKIVKLFKKESEKGDDADLKAWAGQTLPTLEMHLQMIQDIQKKM